MKRLLCTLTLVGLALFARADVVSGPKAGDKVEDFKVFGAVGLFEGKVGSYVKERKGEVTVFIFVQNEHFGRPMARFMKVLDSKGKEANDKSAVVAVWLGDKPDALKDRLPKIQGSMKFENTSLGVFEGEKSGPNNWGINTDAHCTVVVTHKGKVVETIALDSVNETDAKKVVEVLKKVK